MNTGKRVALALLIGLLAATPLAVAQTGETFTRPELEKYVEALDELREINQAYRERIEQAQDREKAIELQSRAQEEMVQAVTSIGLTVAEYNQITDAMRNNPEVYERIVKIQENR